MSAGFMRRVSSQSNTGHDGETPGNGSTAPFMDTGQYEPMLITGSAMGSPTRTFARSLRQLGYGRGSVSGPRR